MKNKISIIVGLILVVVGACISYFAGFASADIIGFAVEMFGAGVAVSSIWAKRDTSKKTWMAILAVILTGLGAFLLGFGGFTEATMTTIITSVLGIVAIIAGIIVSAIQAKQTTTATAG